MVDPADQENTGPITLDSGEYAVFHTTDGDFIVKLYQKETPKTVENFVGLATGRKRWKHPVTLVESSQPLYNNTAIYEIMRDVVIRGGDPLDQGTGDPGYTLDPETPPGVGFDSAGILAMQKSGQKSNGCRWFIALTPFPDWTGKFTAFGKVVGGLDVVREISRKPTKRPFVPLEPTLVNSIEIVEIPANQQTTASFSTEGGAKVLTIEKNFKTVAAPTPTPAPAAMQTTATTTVTSSTVTSGTLNTR
jgi:peptidyl-prolyl cis-trans isomerase A (cyclophilin A)